MTSSILGWIYNLLYRGRAPWEMGEPRMELVELVENGDLEPCRAIDLGCGTGDNVIYLAKKGFEALGVDLSSNAIDQAREKARRAHAPALFMVGDVTRLNGVTGSFDLVIDYGCLGCVIGTTARQRYIQTLLRITHPGSKFLLLNFVRSADSRFNFVPNALKPGEVDQLIGDYFRLLTYQHDREDGPLGFSVEFRVLQKT